ncbi:carnosine N-methyltransferase-like [Acropora millepora]|uniref:carnosine N-methyltransferase-like n=1 Tax=Acropora millepora TaxID=45264 RepID=UPI001CF3DB4F|nr:carnosine N-methyltransferase-like [Acropora millepora]
MADGTDHESHSEDGVGAGIFDNHMETEEDKLERQHFWKVVEAFHFYKHFSARKLQRIKDNYTFLPRTHREMLPHFKDHIKKITQCIEENQNFLNRIVSHTGEMFENRDHTRVPMSPADPASQPISGFDMEKVLTTLKQFVRDWSDEGKSERDACYKPIIEEIQQLYPAMSCSRKDISILVPGAGLGRLMFDIAKLGFMCQGNEWSLYMLFASHFVLNRAPGTYHTTIYPYVHQTCNNKSTADQVRPVSIPDVDPTDVPSGLNFSMAAGDFLEVYTEKDCWDCVVTCYFIDTAHNVIAYIENIAKILKPGGYWINFGPLLYHFSDMANEWSVELSYEDIKRISTDYFKFDIIKEVTSIPSGYIENERSMLKLLYDNVFFVARKPL